MSQSDFSNTDYESLIKQAQQRLRHYIFAIFPNHSACDDILQETNRVLWEKREGFEEGTNFLAWARTIARFQTLSYLKNAKRKSWLSFDSELVVSLTSVAETHDEGRELKSTALKSCMTKLSPTDKEIIALRYTSQMTLKQIGDSVSRSEGALKQAFLKVRLQLKKCIERTLLSAANKSKDQKELPVTIDQETSN